jgi:predicted phosphoribosyltransferase
MGPLYKDRRHAGEELAEALARWSGQEDVVVLGLPRGGVPVAAEIADLLKVDLDVLVVRKLGLPGHEELAMGAVAGGGLVVRNDDVIRSTRPSSRR